MELLLGQSLHGTAASGPKTPAMQAGAEVPHALYITRSCCFVSRPRRRPRGRDACSDGEALRHETCKAH